MRTQSHRDQLLALLRQRAVLRGDFTLSSGQKSDYYLDARLVTLSAEGSGLVGRVLLQALQHDPPDAVAGLSIGADPIVASIACVAGLTGVALDGIIVRKQAKEHGAGGRMVGPWRVGLRVAVVDDTLTTGASAIEAARAVQEAGGTVSGVYALIDRDQGARGAIESAGHAYHHVFTAHELLA